MSNYAKKNHIAFIISSMTSGGAERVVANLSNKFTRMGYKVTIITFNSNGSYYKLNDKIELKNYDYDTSNKIKTFFTSISMCKNAIKDTNPNIIISFMTEINIISIIANLFNRRTLIISERNDPNRSPHQWYYRILRNIFYRFSDGYVFQTNDAKNFFNKKIRKKSIVIHNPVHIVCNGERQDNNIRKEIVSVGRLTECKNQKLLIDAFETISNKYKEYKLIIYGEGELRESLENYIKNKNLEDKIILPGNKKDIHLKIKDSEIFILSSDFEGMPNALMEAMALGIPCISTNCPIGGPGEIIRHGENGILVECKNKNDMVSAIELLLDDKKIRQTISRNARNIIESHSLEIICKQWESYILKINSNINNK